MKSLAPEVQICKMKHALCEVQKNINLVLDGDAEAEELLMGAEWVIDITLIECGFKTEPSHPICTESDIRAWDLRQQLKKVVSVWRNLISNQKGNN